MTIPNFTAEASLFHINVRYQAHIAPGFKDEIQPAQSDVFHPDRPLPFLYSDVYHPRPLYCLKRRCTNVAPPGYPPKLLCRWELGFWNRVTASCE